MIATKSAITTLSPKLILPLCYELLVFVPFLIFTSNLVVRFWADLLVLSFGSGLWCISYRLRSLKVARAQVELKKFFEWGLGSAVGTLGV